MTETSKFDRLAAVYATARPPYPDGTFTAIEELSGRPLAGARIADVGAGTGISTRQLRDRGAVVTAVDLSAPMLKQLVADSPGVSAVQASANALPLADSCLDFVTFAQSWHWVDPERATAEVIRVLRPGGALSCFWNTPRSDRPWRLGYDDRIRELIGGDPDYGNKSTRWGTAPVIEMGPGTDLETRALEVPWSREVSIEAALRDISSRSYTADVPADRMAAFLDAERALLLERFPDGVVLQEYVTWVGVVVM